MKKFISIMLSLILTFSITPAAFAKTDNTPVIFVPGYTSSRMFINRGTQDEKRVWKVDVADKIIAALEREAISIFASSGKIASGNYDALFKILEPYANEITEYLRINDDGTSKYEVEVYPHSVEATRLDKLDEYGYHPDSDTLKLLRKYRSSTDIYCCTLDWRLGQIDNARVLNDYIDDVLEATGAQKVNILGVSYGGQVTASYLSIYGGDKVKNAVLHSPALDGSSIVPQLFSDKNIEISWSDLLKLAQAYGHKEADYSQITNILSPDFLNGFLKAFFDYYLYDLFLNFGSVWDLVPLEQYKKLRDRLLNDGNHTELLEKSDKYHFEIAANRENDLKRLKSEGVSISIVAGYGYHLAVDNSMNSDAVIEVKSTTGAVCANIGKALGADYVNGACENPLHCHLSPNGCIDASKSYLPENTWLVEDMFHGLGTNENTVSRLLCDLLFANEGFDVHSNPDYPQFMTSDNAFMGVMCTFSSCAEGYMTPYSTEMTVTNLSKENSIIIDKIKTTGISLIFGYTTGQTLAPGESVSFSVFGNLPETDLLTFKVKIDYLTQNEKINIAESRVQSFRYTNSSLYGEALTVTVDENTSLITNNDNCTQSDNETNSFFSWLGYYFKKLLACVAVMLKGMLK